MTITKTEKISSVDLESKVQYVCVYFVYKLLWVYVHNRSVTETQDCDFFNFFTNPKHRCRSCVCVCVNHWMLSSCVHLEVTLIILAGTPVMSCSCQLMILIQYLISTNSTHAHYELIESADVLRWRLKEKSTPLKNSSISLRRNLILSTVEVFKSVATLMLSCLFKHTHPVMSQCTDTPRSTPLHHCSTKPPLHTIFQHSETSFSNASNLRWPQCMRVALRGHGRNHHRLKKK